MAMKRWIIRSFFIGLLLLCVCGWVVSSQRVLQVIYVNTYGWGFGCWRGNINLLRVDRRYVYNENGLYLGSLVVSPVVIFPPSPSYSFAGFQFSDGPLKKHIGIPFWFPTTISAALLWLVWRKTRPKPKG